MVTRLWTSLLVGLAGVSVLAWLVAFMHEKEVRPAQDLVAFFKKQPKAGRVLLGAFFIAMWIMAGEKPGDDGGTPGGEGGATDIVQMVVGPDTGTMGVPPVASAGEGRLRFLLYNLRRGIGHETNVQHDNQPLEEREERRALFPAFQNSPPPLLSGGG